MYVVMAKVFINNGQQAYFEDGSAPASGGGIDISLAGGGIRKPCSLPEEERRLEREALENERAGIYDDDYVCELCRVGNQGRTAEASEVLRKVYEMDEMLFGTLPEDEICTSIANYWNNTLYRIDQRLGGKYRVRQLQKAAVRLHLRYHKRSPRRIIWNRINFLELSIEREEMKGVWEQGFESNGPGKDDMVAEGEPEMNTKKWKNVKEMNQQLMEFLKLDMTFVKQREKDRPAQNNFMANNMVFNGGT